jgi:hypothetical protein
MAAGAAATVAGLALPALLPSCGPHALISALPEASASVPIHKLRDVFELKFVTPMSVPATVRRVYGQPYRSVAVTVFPWVSPSEILHSAAVVRRHCVAPPTMLECAAAQMPEQT